MLYFTESKLLYPTYEDCVVVHRLHVIGIEISKQTDVMDLEVKSNVQSILDKLRIAGAASSNSSARNSGSSVTAFRPWGRSDSFDEPMP